MSILYPVTAAQPVWGADQVRPIVDESGVMEGVAVAPKLVGGSGAEAATPVNVMVLDVVEVAWLFDATSRTWYVVALSGAQLVHVFVVYVVVDRYMPGPPPPTMVGLGTSVSAKYRG